MARKLASVVWSVVVLACVLPLAAQERLNDEINWRIRQEETEHSQIMRTLHYLSDVYGPRLTGSPSLKAAGEWAIKQMQSWGFQNGHLEGWNWGHPGWSNERFSAYMVAPVKARLVGEVVAWTSSTNGTATGVAARLTPPERPTKEELAAYLETQKDAVRGKMVLVGKPAVIPVSFNPPAKRRDEAELRSQYDPNNPNPVNPFGPPAAALQAQQNQRPGVLNNNQVTQQIDEFLIANAALVRVNDAAREHGQLIAYANRAYDVSKGLPTVILRNDDYGRIWRILDDGTPVQLEFNIVNQTYPEGVTAYNTIAEIPGSDPKLKDEVVMLGGHLDSWHAATGATDNAIGCATMMEAARILKAIGVKPRRTIRVALWSGEEEGLLGSLAYVKEHYGSAEEPKPEFAKFAGYLNIDSGTGRARGASVFGPPEGATIVRQTLAPFADLGVMGAIATRSRRVGGTDSTSFNNAGLPGIGFGQDPIEYNTHTHHTNLDTYERIIEGDVKASAMAIAATVYQLAMRDEALPRFAKDQMPPPAPATTNPTPAPAGNQ